MGEHSYTATVEVRAIGPVETFGSKGYQKRIMHGQTQDAKYPQVIAFEFGKGTMDKLDGIAVGDVVTVTFDLRGTGVDRYPPTGGRVFTSLAAWKIELDGGTVAARGPSQPGDDGTPVDVPPIEEKMPF